MKNKNAIRFDSKAECEAMIANGFSGCSAVFVSDHYAAAYGLLTGGWYMFHNRCNYGGKVAQ